MSKKFIYHRSHEDTMNDSKVVKEEYLRDGEKGLTFRFMHFDKKKNHYKKIVGKLSEDGKKVNIGIKEEGKEIVKSEIKVADLKKHKELKFVVDYMAKHMDKFRKTLKGGKRKYRKSKNSKKRKSRKRKSRRKSRRSSKRKSKRKSRKRKSRKSRKRKSRRRSRK